MVFITDLNSLSVPTNILLLIVTAYYANITRCMLNQSKKEQRMKDIKESLKCFYHPVKDILEVYCSLFQMNHEVSEHHSKPRKSLKFGNIEYHAIEHSEKMTKLRDEYLSRKENSDTLDVIIKTGTDESNKLLIHLITVDKLKKMKLRRHFANNSTRKKFEEYIDCDPYKDINVKLEDYLKQKTNEIANLLELINRDIKDYEGELNNYSLENKKKP